MSDPAPAPLAIVPLGADRVLPRPDLAAWLRQRRTRGLLLQILAGLLILIVLAAAVATVSANLARLNLTAGFGFLLRPAGFPIAETILPYQPGDSFLRAMAAGLVNTLRVSAAAVVLATILGTTVGVMRLTPNPLLRGIAGVYVETLRNTPLLLQLLLWSALLLRLPPVRQAIPLGGGAWLSQRGLTLPALTLTDPLAALPWAAGAAILTAAALIARGRRAWIGPASALAFAAGFAASGALGVEVPVRRPFGFNGGMLLSPEFVALLAGLTLYASAFIAEIVRGGILAVPRGQTEAARGLGLKPAATLRLIVLPQAVRIVLPSMTSQYVGIVKNSSLAIAIGYPDVFWAVSTTINITGHALEGVFALMLGYLLLTLSAAGGMNALYARMMRRGRTESGGGAGEQRRAAQAGGPGPVARFFGTMPNAVVTLSCLAVLGLLLPPAYDWAVRDAVWSGASEDCRRAAGACWAYVGAKTGFFLFGFYPLDERWRAAAATGLLFLLPVVSLIPRLWTWRLVPLWIATLIAAIWLLGGGGLGLAPVASDSWSGLPLTLLLADLGLTAGFPLGLLLALGRRSTLPLPRIVCTGFIELLRGVPFITVLFMASVTVPLLVPQGVTPDKLFRAAIAFTLVAGVFIAEAVRGGLASVPAGQSEAARALGFGYWREMGLIVLPQCLRISVPALVNISVSFFKDTSLVVAIGLFDLLGAINSGAHDPRWLGFEPEGYLFAAAIYVTVCFSMTRYAAWLERRLHNGAAAPS